MRIRSRLLAAFSLLLAASPAAALDPVQPLTHYGRTLWSQDRGLPSGTVYALAQDAEGYLWLGTDRGLVRFDGTDFVEWTAPGGPALPRSRVYAVVAARDRRLWVAYSNGGVSQIAGDRVVNYPSQHGLLEGYVLALFEHTDGTIWAAGQSGVARFGNGRWERVGSAEGLPDAPSTRAYQDAQGGVWVATSVGTYRKLASASRFERISSRLISGAAVDASGTTWITDDEHGFADLRASRPVDWTGGARGGRELFLDRHGVMWLTTTGSGIWRIRPGARGASSELALAGGDEGALREDVWDILEDRDGNMWFGTTRGLLRLSDNDVTMISSREGLSARNTRAVAAAPDGRIWVGTTDGLYSLSEDSIGQIVARREKSGNVSALHFDPSGQLWIASDFSIGTFANGQFHPLPIPAGGLISNTFALAADREGGVWICNFFQGALRWHNGRLDDSAAAATGRRPCGSLLVDGAGLVWVGFRAGGVAVYGNGQLHFLGEAEGVRGNGSTPYIARDGALWVSTTEGLFRFRHDRFDQVVDRSQFPGDLRAEGIVQDDADLFWVGVSSGVLRLNPGDSENGTHQSRLFDASDGLVASIAAVVSGSPTAARSPDGRLWFATEGGVGVINPQRLKPSRAPSVPRIEQVLSDDRLQLLDEALVLAPGTSRVEIRYASLNLSAPKNLRFRYRLEGFDEDWIDAGSRRQAFYTNLPPRTYRFLVMASDNEGRWTGASASLPFELRPRFYQSDWFYAACAIGASLMVAGAWWLRLRVVQNRFKSILAERARVGREIHDGLLQSLGSVSLQLEVVASGLKSTPDSAADSLRRLRGQVTQCIREARESIWELRSATQDGPDFVSVLRAAAERLVAGKGVHFSMTVTGRYRPCARAVEEQLLKIAQESLNNALRHGQPRHVTIELDYPPDSVFMRVSDDGRGFDPLDRPGVETGHWGVISMRERAATIGGSFSIASHLGGGTQVETVVPMQAES